MTAAALGRERHQLPVLVRRLGAVVAVAALAALIALGPPVQAAKAANSSGFDQITGSGTTASAVTASWTAGLLGTNNKPLSSSPATELAPNSDRSKNTGPLSFMYADFKNLKVTVSQTQNITNQGVTVKWTGGQASSVSASGPQGNFLQLMECYGDSGASASGPDPEHCEYGSPGLVGNATNKAVGSRGGFLCTPGASASTINPPASADGSGPLNGCDPEEPGNANPPHTAPCTATPCTTATDVSIPFVSVNAPTQPAYGSQATGQYFDEFTTNEVQEAATDKNGNGQLQFETLTATQAPGLGCGQLESNGQPQNCWLVIVPRGTFEPNGFKVNIANSGAPSGFLYSSPLEASNWAMRIQIHLGYAPVTAFCPIGTQERQTVGTQVMTRAMDSWELALNKQANCARIYGFSAVPEATSTTQLCNPTATTIGLAFTTIPIGSEAARDGTVPGCPTLPKILYAPVAVTAVGLGFNIDDGAGRITAVKMSPELLAKSITQVYRFDLPDYYPPCAQTCHLEGPGWSQSNPFGMSNDPEFQKLNPKIPPYGFSASSTAPLLTEDHSALIQQVWQWMQTDPATVAWLDKGTKSAANDNTVTADPDYEKLHLGKGPGIDSFPRAYSGVLELPPQSPANPSDPNTTPNTVFRRSLDLLPYAGSFTDAASKVLTADNTSLGDFDSQAIAPNGATGWWDANGVEPLGEIFIWGISDTPDLAGFGLIDAQLCNDAGGNCIAPSTASVSAALASAKPDAAGLLQVNPAKAGKGGYPLVQVTYAAVPTNQSAVALSAYADLIAYAAGAGQTAGAGPGDLPPGYLPLTKTLKNQAQAVVAKLRKLAGGGSSAGSHSPGTSTSPTTRPGSSGGSVTPSPASSSPAEFTISNASPQLAAATTQKQVLGAIRWALLVVVIAGAACATGGAALRSARVPAWLKRMRT